MGVKKGFFKILDFKKMGKRKSKRKSVRKSKRKSVKRKSRSKRAKRSQSTKKRKSRFSHHHSPNAFITVLDNTHRRRVLVVRDRNSSKKGWMLPGGNVDKTDKNSKAGVKRELREESGYNLKENKIKFYKTDRSQREKADIYYATFAFGKLGHKKRVEIFRERGTPWETSDYGFVALVNGTLQVQDYSGRPKKTQYLRTGTENPTREMIKKLRKNK